VTAHLRDLPSFLACGYNTRPTWLCYYTDTVWTVFLMKLDTTRSRVVGERTEERTRKQERENKEERTTKRAMLSPPLRLIDGKNGLRQDDAITQ
jgi:hypothetical protein